LGFDAHLLKTLDTKAIPDFHFCEPFSANHLFVAIASPPTPKLVASHHSQNYGMGIPDSLKANLKTSFAASVTVVLAAVLLKDCPHLTSLPRTVGSLSAFLAKSCATCC